MSLSAVVLLTPDLHADAGVDGKRNNDVFVLPSLTNRLTLHLPSSRSPARPPGFVPPANASQNAAVVGPDMNRQPLLPPVPPGFPEGGVAVAGGGAVVGTGVDVVATGVDVDAGDPPGAKVPPAPARIR